MVSPSRHEPAGLSHAQHNRSFQKIVEHLTQLISEVHRLVNGCDQCGAQEFDLTAELGALQAAYERIGNLRMTLALHPAAIEVLTQQEAREILHIVREALGTRVHEGQVTRATVSIRKRGARISIRIWDDGAGPIPVDSRIPGDRAVLIKSRVRKLRGTMRLQVKEGRGTQLLVEFSLEPILVSV